MILYRTLSTDGLCHDDENILYLLYIIKTCPGLCFSALDAENEFLVQEALERLMDGRTVLIIAHRLSTIQSADAVAVLDQHRVMEIGSHAQLLANDQGLFHKLMEKQAFLQSVQKKAVYK